MLSSTSGCCSVQRNAVVCIGMLCCALDVEVYIGMLWSALGCCGVHRFLWCALGCSGLHWDIFSVHPML